MYTSILLLASLSAGQSPQYQYAGLPPQIQSKSEACVFYQGLGHKRVWIVNGLVPSIREDIDECGCKTVVFDYSKRIPYNAARSTTGQPSVSTPPAAAAPVNRSATSDEIAELRKDIAEIRKQLGMMNRSTKTEERRMPRIEDDDQDPIDRTPQRENEKVPLKEKPKVPLKEKPRTPALPEGMRRPSDVADEKPKT